MGGPYGPPFGLVGGLRPPTHPRPVETHPVEEVLKQTLSQAGFDKHVSRRGTVRPRYPKRDSERPSETPRDNERIRGTQRGPREAQGNPERPGKAQRVLENPKPA